MSFHPALEPLENRQLLNAVTFTDGTFNDSDWTGTKVPYDDSANHQFDYAAAVSSFTSGQVAANGNPGPYQGMTKTWTGPGGILAGELKNDAIYDPSRSGAISSINFSLDGIAFSIYAADFRLLLLQNHTFYISSALFYAFKDQPWQHFTEKDQTAADFFSPLPWDQAHPDFTSSGGPIQFGYLSGNGTPSARTFTVSSGVDNWSVTLNTQGTDIAPTSLTWDNSQGGADFSYSVTGGNLPAGTTAALYWATGASFADVIGNAIYSTAAQQAAGSYGPINAPASTLGTPPQGASDLLVVTDPNNLLGESNVSDNVLALGLPSASIEINDTSETSSKITLFNPADSPEPYTQTIPAKITNLSSADETIQLSVNSRAATLSQTTVSLAGGSSTEITITPRADSSVVNDVQVIATVGGIQVAQDQLTIVGAGFPQHIRNSDTPYGMRDRIPPTAITPIAFALTPDLSGSGLFVTLTAIGQSDNNGKITINGNPFGRQSLTSFSIVDLSGVLQTDSGVIQTDPGTNDPGGHYAGNLQITLQVRGQNTIQSNGFSVAAIPVNWSDTFDQDLTSQLRDGPDVGMVVKDDWKSDSGNIADLDQVKFRELVPDFPSQAKGILANSIEESNHHYSRYPMNDSSFASDQHTIPKSVFGPDAFGLGGSDVVNQIHLFRDLRTGDADIPIDHSGYVITTTVRPAARRAGAGWTVTTTKVGEGATVDGIYSKAGNGNISHPEFVSEDANGHLAVNDLPQVSPGLNGDQVILVASLYEAILGRFPDPGGLQFWATLLQSGATRQQVAQGLWESPEHRGIQVDSFYGTYLHRAADPAGRAFWVSAFEAGMNETGVTRGFLTSAEYTLAHPDTDSLIASLYADVLERAAQAAEIAGWDLLSRVPGFGRVGVIEGVLTSNEADRRIIENDYRSLLERDPDTSGEQFWVSVLQTGQGSATSVAEAFLASDEYFARLGTA